MGGESDQLVDEVGGRPDLGDSKFDQNKSWDGRSAAAPSGILTGGRGRKILGTDRRRPGNTTSWSLLKTGGRPWTGVLVDGRPGSTTSWSSRMGRERGRDGRWANLGRVGPVGRQGRGGEDGGRGKDRRPWTRRGQEGTVLTVSDQLAGWTGDRPVRGEPRDQLASVGTGDGTSWSRTATGGLGEIRPLGRGGGPAVRTGRGRPVG